MPAQLVGPCEECGTETEVEQVEIAPGDQVEEWYLCEECRADLRRARRLAGP